MHVRVPIFRWLPAAAFLLALPAWPQKQVDEAPSTYANTARGTASGDIPVIDGSPELPPQLTSEEMGDLLSGRRQYQGAIESYSKVQQPSAAVWNAMGIDYQMMFDLKDAARCYRKALKIAPLNPNMLNNLATALDESKKFGTAERTYRKALEIDPRSALILKNLGTNLLTQHKYEKGSKIYSRALAIDPHIFNISIGPSIDEPATIKEHGTTNYFKAQSCARAGLNDCAIALLRRAFSEGSVTANKVANDSAFEKMRGDPDLDLLLAQQH